MKQLSRLLLAGLLAFVLPAHAQKISADPTASTLTGSEYIAAVQSGANVKMLPSQILTYARANIFAVNAQTGTSYTYLAGDLAKLVTHTNASSIAGTLPQATGSFGAGWFMQVQNRGAGTLTITPTTSTIDGASSLALATGEGVFIGSDGTNYFTQRGRGVGDALKSGTLAQFAATTSAQLAGVISDETGSGALVFATSPTLSNPVVGTQSAGDNSTKAASTAYVDAAVSSGGGGTVTHTAGALTANRIVLGNGTDDVTVLGSLGTTTTVLHGNAAGAPTFGAVSLTADVSGTCRSPT
jgi:hypothetical protein